VRVLWFSPLGGEGPETGVRPQIKTTSHQNRSSGSAMRTITTLFLSLISVVMIGGCEVDSFFNPSVTGYYERTPTSMPILDRIDIIER
jgi:hypothetical protein